MENDEKNDRFNILELINEDDEEEVVMRKIKEYCDQLRRLIREAAQKEIEEVIKVADEVTQRINNEERRTINKIPNAGK
jgi:hypothetical protein